MRGRAPGKVSKMGEVGPTFIVKNSMYYYPVLVFSKLGTGQNLYPTIINTIAMTRMIATTRIVTKCCFICRHNELNLATIALSPLHD